MNSFATKFPQTTKNTYIARKNISENESITMINDHISGKRYQNTKQPFNPTSHRQWRNRSQIVLLSKTTNHLQ